LVKQKEAQVMQTESQVRELTEKNRSMEGERFTQKHRYISLKEKVSELETEKKRLTDLLESSVSSLENAMSEKLKLSQQQFQRVSEQLSRQKSDFEGVELQILQKQEDLQREQLHSSQVFIHQIQLRPIY
jgi:type IV secretory pathway VirB4 component